MHFVIFLDDRAKPRTRELRSRVGTADFNRSLKKRKEPNKMTLYDELVARGLIAQVTDEEEIKDLINNGKATFLYRI